MRNWSLSPQSVLSLRLAADARVSTPDYMDDQIWELSLEGGEPASVALQTTYGLRARGMRIFPGFSLGEAVVSDPGQFYSGPVLQHIFPNYASILFAPFQELEVRAEFWIVDSHTVAGRFGLSNLSGDMLQLQMRLFSLLVPAEGGERMSAWHHMGVASLAGRTENLAPVIFIMGGAQVEQTVYPSLVLNRALPPGEMKSILWAHAGQKDSVSSFEAARAAASRPWEAEIAKLELLNESMIDIETGEEEWDAAFQFSQKVAIGSFVGPTRALPNPSFVLSRNPDRGCSRRGDGSDHNWQWDGQTAMHAAFLLPLVIHSAPELAKGVVRNFLSVQKPNGFIDWKPGLGGQRNGALAQPLIATLAWKVYEHTQDRQFLRDVFPGLLEFIKMWFTPEHDRDGDGFPEWDHTLQMGFDDCPSFVPWRLWGQGLDITKVETPDLASYLYRECQSLIRAAKELHLDEHIPPLEERVGSIQKFVDGMWSDEGSLYRYRDRDVHHSPKGEKLGSGSGEFSIPVERTFPGPVRIVIQSMGQEGLKHSAKVFIHGRGGQGRHRVEQLREKHFQWFSNIGTATSEKSYVEIERIEVSGFSNEFETIVSTADFAREDVSLLLPLWAGIPDLERAEILVRETILNPERFWRPFGISSCSSMDPAYEAANNEGAGGVWMYANMLLGEALLAYGFRIEAAGLFQNLMQAILLTLRREKAFREIYHPDFSKGSGERDHICGLVPLGLFLACLGIHFIKPNEFVLRGDNPFPWPVTVRWKGIEIRCFEEHKEVIFPNGEQLEIVGSEPRLIKKSVE
ncbi:MAG: hypothetical protein A2Z14_11555 [Chloroflexi bacterium RBG_16_48_8]|nr:MAG: hypothetical protein A2Z14_11555 [Chloroflexi bacterium RBG_16_48_8]